MDLLALGVHSVLIFGFTFLTTLMGANVAATITRAQVDSRTHLVGAAITAGSAALLKVILYLGARTGAPLDGAAAPPSRGR